MTDETQNQNASAPEASPAPVSPPNEPNAAPAEPAEASSSPTDDVGARAPDEEGSAETSAGREAGEAVEAGEASDTEDSSDDEAGAASEGKRKRKRKRKKKKPGAGAEGATATSSGGERRPQAFTHLFDGAPRAHAFRAGEIVAGRVDRVADGCIVVDLFGKALAFVDEHEPREVPVIEVKPEPIVVAEPAPEDSSEAASSEAASSEAVSSEAAPSEAAPEDVSADSATVATHVVEDSSAGDLDAEAAEAEEAAAAEAASDDEEEESDEVEAEADAEAPPPEPPPLGSIFRGRVGAVAESGHVIIVNRIVDVPAAKARIAEAREKRKRVRGVVYGFNRGGFDVLVEGVRTFCPAGGMALGPIDDPAAHVGKKLEFTLPPIKGSGRSIIVSRRGLLERELRRAAKHRLKDLKIGERLRGAVTQVREFGLLVDLGDGLEGLVHQSEVSWSRVGKPSDAAKVGDVVDVEVLKVQPATRKDRTGRVSLSMRRCLPDPWAAHADAVTPGAVHKGVITRTAEFGAFVRIAPDIEGLLHISELGGRDLKHASEVLNEGDEIDVLVERVDREARRISLSRLTPADLEAIEKGELDPSISAKSLKPGAHVTVVIERVEPHGVLAQVKGVLGRRGRAYLPNRELSAEGADRKKAYVRGRELTVKIIGTDRDGALKCSIKGMLVDEERKAVRDYRKEAAKAGFGTFGDLLRAKISDDPKR
ncbi:MAG: S1 RNA-binding domain-containing protein [Myxococcales bacterium]|nr:S1 RNA-binding domain-containing protein [Myxococcales bacterium]